MTLEQYPTIVLQRAAAAVMRAYLDYDAGHGSERLRGLLTPEAAAALDDYRPESNTAVDGARAAVGPYWVLRLDPDRAYVCAGVLDPGGNDTVLAAELVARGGTVQAARIGRAAEATTRRDAVAPRDPGPVGDGQPPPEPPAHLHAMLGDLPADPQARERWLLGAAVIDTFRERHGIHDATLALGDQPEDAEQRVERARAVGYLRDLASEIARLEPGRAAEPSGREPGRGQELGR